MAKWATGRRGIISRLSVGAIMLRSRLEGHADDRMPAFHCRTIDGSDGLLSLADLEEA